VAENLSTQRAQSPQRAKKRNSYWLGAAWIDGSKEIFNKASIQIEGNRRTD
jgi:capsid protein